MTGIVGYGVCIPKYRIKTDEIANVWGEEPERISKGLGIIEKSVPDIDEDSATLAVEAGRNALARAGINPQEIGAVYIGSESHPYAVKPTATIVAEALGATAEMTAADIEFACKAGTAGMQMCMGMVASGMAKYGLAIGSDTAQGRPGDALEYSAAAGAAAYIIGKKDGNETIADIEDTFSFSTDTPDFWRRQHSEFPSHGGRFTGEPAYFKHVLSATKGLLKKMGAEIREFDYVVFHQPNGKFPRAAAKKLGVEPGKLEQGLLVPKIGNTYSGAAMLGLASVLDVAKEGERVLVTSFGSGAGSDSFALKVNGSAEKKRDLARKCSEYIEDKEYLSYGKYVKHRRKLKSL